MFKMNKRIPQEKQERSFMTLANCLVAHERILFEFIFESKWLGATGFPTVVLGT